MSPVSRRRRLPERTFSQELGRKVVSVVGVTIETIDNLTCISYNQISLNYQLEEYRLHVFINCLTISSNQYQYQRTKTKKLFCKIQKHHYVAGLRPVSPALAIVRSLARSNHAGKTIDGG